MPISGLCKRFLPLGLLMASPGVAQAPQSFPASSPISPPSQPGAVTLSVRGSDRLPHPEQWASIGDDTMARNVSVPTLQPFFPPTGRGNGTAVIVAPGGAFMALSMDNEGWAVAKWLAAHGVTAFVLKYRLDPTPPDEPGFAAAIGARTQTDHRGSPGDSIKTYDPKATEDGFEALREVRRRAAEWHIDPHRVGFMGFSAGAELTRRMALSTDPASRPDFAGIIYGPLQSASVPADAPPLFTALASDDAGFGRQGFGLVQAWQTAGRPVELHFYQRGAHGFGMHKQGTTSDLWIEQFWQWLALNEFGTSGDKAR